MMKQLTAWVLLFALFLPGCAGKKAEESPALLETGVAAENADDFTLAGGELWVLEDGEAKPAGNLSNNLPFPDGYRAKYMSSDGENPVFCSEDGVLCRSGELFRLPVPEDTPEVTSFAVAGDTAVAAYRHIMDGWGALSICSPSPSVITPTVKGLPTLPGEITSASMPGETLFFCRNFAV